MADYLANAWEDLLNLLKDNQQTIFQNPLVWIILGLVVVGIYGLYDVPKKTSMNSLGNVVRKLIQTLLDTVSDMINALGSLTGFLKVVENLLFGKLNKKTLFVLNNFAIIFLSMASFITTFFGLNQVVDWVVAAFVSFGIQVSILVYSIKISACYRYIKKNSKKDKSTKDSEDFLETGRKTKEVARVTYKFSLPADDYIIKKSLKFDGERKTEHFVGPRTEGRIKDYKEEHEAKLKRTKKIRTRVIILLAGSIIISSSFSYLFMFEKFVSRQLPYDDHFRSIKTVHTIIKSYSDELHIYEDGLVEILSTYNDKVSEWMRIQESNPKKLQEDLTTKSNELEDLEEQEKELEVKKTPGISPEELAALEIKLDDIEGEIAKAKDDLETLKRQEADSIYQYRWTAYESILKMKRLYTDPLYIKEADMNDLQESFSNLIQAEAQYQATAEISEDHSYFTERQRNRIEAAFNMYFTLCKYYMEHNNASFDFTAVEEQLNKNYEDAADAKAYQENTNALLAEMLKSLNKVSILSTIVSPWNDKSVAAPNQEGYLAKLYDMYRDSRGTVTNFERAYNKLIGRNGEKTTLSRELWALAITLDLLIVWLTLLRGKKHFVSELGDLRRLVGVLMLDDSLEEASISYRKSQGFCCVLGIVSGVLMFLLYKMNYAVPSAESPDDMFTFLIFCLFGLIAGLLINKLYTKVFLYKKNWDADNLYLLWKQIWMDSGKDEKELKKHINNLRERNDYEAVQISEEGRKALEKYCADTQQQVMFTKYIYQNVLDLFNGIEMIDLYKIVTIKTIHKNQLMGVDYVAEPVSMSCIAESTVKKHNMQIQFNILMNRHLVEFDRDYYILTERFWGLLYDAILLCIVGGRISDHDIEEELAANGEDKEELY